MSYNNMLEKAVRFIKIAVQYVKEDIKQIKDVVITIKTILENRNKPKHNYRDIVPDDAMQALREREAANQIIAKKNDQQQKYPTSNRPKLDEQQKTGNMADKYKSGNSVTKSMSDVKKKEEEFSKSVNNSNIYLVRGDNQDKKAWYYLEVDPVKMPLFKRDINKSSIDLSLYGTILECGWGKNPPQDLIDKYGGELEPED
jgi:hypothetical protein